MVLEIQLMDLSPSVDNVVAAVAMSPQIWVVVTGVCLGLPGFVDSLDVCLVELEAG